MISKNLYNSHLKQNHTTHAFEIGTYRWETKTFSVHVEFNPLGCIHPWNIKNIIKKWMGRVTYGTVNIMLSFLWSHGWFALIYPFLFYGLICDKCLMSGQRLAEASSTVCSWNTVKLTHVEVKFMILGLWASTLK